MFKELNNNLKFFLRQFLTSLNENIFRNLFLILTCSKVYQNKDITQFKILITSIIFLLPYLLFSGIAGSFSDRYGRKFLLKKTKIFDIFVYFISFIAILTKNFKILYGSIFLIGCSSIFYETIKLSKISSLVEKFEYLKINSIVISSFFLSFFVALCISSLVINEFTTILVASLILIIAIINYKLIEDTIEKEKYFLKSLKVDNFIISTIKNFKILEKRTYLFLSAMGIAWFWFVSTMFINQLMTFAKFATNNNEFVAISLIGIFVFGIISGCYLCNKIFREKINAAFTPISAIIITIFTFKIYLNNIEYQNFQTNNLIEFLKVRNNISLIINLLITSICAGIYIIPLYSSIHKNTKKFNRSRIFSSVNFINSIFILISLFLFYSFSKINFYNVDIFLFISIANLIVGCYILTILPKQTLFLCFKWIIGFLFNVKINGLENYKKLGDKKAIIIANHQSFLDVVLISLFIEENLSFAVEVNISKKWWIKPFLKMANTYPIDSRSPMALKTLINLVKSGKRIMIFPEGRITTTGGMMKIYEGPAMIAEKANAELLPIRIEGAQYSIFSRLKNKTKRKLFPDISLTILSPEKIVLPEGLTARKKRVEAGNKLYDLMIELFYHTININETIVESILNKRKTFGGGHIALEDINFKPISYRTMFMKAFILGNYISRFTSNQEYVGVLLPNSCAIIILFLGLELRNRIPVMLNFSAGSRNILSACKTTKLKYVFTSRVFIEKAKLEKVIETLLNNNINVIFLEDEVSKIKTIDKISAIFYNIFPKISYKILNKNKLNYNNPCVVLFTSGSEGDPKGVALSHRNINANRAQLATSILFKSTDIVFVALPIFHSFGLGAALIGLGSGSKVFLYPSPLHYRIIPELIYRTNSTIMFGTNTFLERYAKYANPYDFYSLKFVAIGGEKLTEQNRNTWMSKLGVRVFEGYGTTETSPIIAFNNPMRNKEGTVGRPVPALKCEIEKVDNIENGGKLIVSGDSVMLGYILKDKPGIIQKIEEKYDTGDIVEIDREGYITIKGRVKRFAKIAGEMISMAMIESEVNKLWKDYTNAIITEKDIKKGEKLIIISNKNNANLNDIIDFFKKEGLSELATPREIRYMEEIPLLGTGKINYVELDRILNKVD